MKKFCGFTSFLLDMFLDAEADIPKHCVMTKHLREPNACYWSDEINNLSICMIFWCNMELEKGTSGQVSFDFGKYFSGKK